MKIIHTINIQVWYEYFSQLEMKINFFSTFSIFTNQISNKAASSLRCNEKTRNVSASLADFLNHSLYSIVYPFVHFAPFSLLSVHFFLFSLKQLHMFNFWFRLRSFNDVLFWFWPPYKMFIILTCFIRSYRTQNLLHSPTQF